MLSVKRQVQILTPVNNVSVGELIPVSVTDEAHSEEDSLSVPSYSEVSIDIANLELMWMFVQWIVTLSSLRWNKMSHVLMVVFLLRLHISLTGVLWGWYILLILVQLHMYTYSQSGCSCDDLFIVRMLDYHSIKWPIWRTILFSYMFIPIVYMFRVLMCSSSGELIVSIRHLLCVTLCRWPSGMQVWVFHPNLHTRRSPT